MTSKPNALHKYFFFYLVLSCIKNSTPPTLMHNKLLKCVQNMKLLVKFEIITKKVPKSML